MNELIDLQVCTSNNWSIQFIWFILSWNEKNYLKLGRWMWYMSNVFEPRLLQWWHVMLFAIFDFSIDHYLKSKSIS